MATATRTRTLAASPDEQFKLSLDSYRRMIEAGVFDPDDRAELLDGVLVNKMPKGARHATAVTKTYKCLIRLLPGGWTVRQEQPVELPDGPEGDSAPEPDVAVVRGSDDDYKTRHPGPGDVALVIQFTDAAPHREAKNLVRFGWANVAEVRVVDLNRGDLTAYRDPTGPCDRPGYAHQGPPLTALDASLSVTLDGVAHGPIFLEEMLG